MKALYTLAERYSRYQTINDTFLTYTVVTKEQTDSHETNDG